MPTFLRESSAYSQKFSRLLAKFTRIIISILKFSKQQKLAELAFVIKSMITCFPGTGKHLYHLLLLFINT